MIIKKVIQHSLDSTVKPHLHGLIVAVFHKNRGPQTGEVLGLVFQIPLRKHFARRMQSHISHLKSIALKPVR